MTAPFNSDAPADLGWFFFSFILGIDLWGTVAMDTVLLPFTLNSDYAGLSDTPYLSR
jgi:uncharacterized protein YceK